MEKGSSHSEYGRGLSDSSVGGYGQLDWFSPEGQHCCCSRPERQRCGPELLKECWDNWDFVPTGLPVKTGPNTLHLRPLQAGGGLQRILVAVAASYGRNCQGWSPVGHDWVKNKSNQHLGGGQPFLPLTGFEDYGDQGKMVGYCVLLKGFCEQGSLVWE